MQVKTLKMSHYQHAINKISFMHKIAFVVPTKDREKDLRVMLTSLQAQTYLPDQIIVVDGSKPVIKHVVDEFPKLSIDYIRVFPPSLSKQRNAGMALLRDDITLAGYLDDDLELESDAIEKMLKFWETATNEIGGAAFAITNAGDPKGTRIKEWFGLDATKRGRVLDTGWTSMLGAPKQTIEVDWLCGGATVWRRSVVETFQYDDWFQGTGFMEDIDFSYNVGSQYKLILVAEAKVAHYHHPVQPSKHVLLGKWQIVNRLYFVKKYRSRGLSLFKAWVASFGVMILNLILGVTRRDSNRFRCALGNLIGVLIAAVQGEKKIGGHLK